MSLSVGESGLGKSMFLRDLVRRASQTVVFLPATRCAQGVLDAIRARWKARPDPEYLRKLIYAGAIDSAIDGLNEVSADTRARVVEFAETRIAPHSENREASCVACVIAAWGDETAWRRRHLRYNPRATSLDRRRDRKEHLGEEQS